MTNGEKIKAMFPNITESFTNIDEYTNKPTRVEISVGMHILATISVDVWNAEYKEPITRNCFGCKYSKDNHNAGTEECHLCMWENQYTPTTKNDLGVDLISREQAQTEIEMNASRYTIAKERGGMGQVEWSDQLIKVSDAVDIIRHLPPVTPQEPTDKKFTKAELDSIVKAINSGWELRVKEVLDKIRAEIEKEADTSNRLQGVSEIGLRKALKIIDKYKAETEET